jgi:hypothetical protein
MAQLKGLEPKEAAEFVLDNIKSDPTKLKALEQVCKSNNVFIGVSVLKKVYGFPSHIEDWRSELEQKLYEPLGFTVTPPPGKSQDEAELDMLAYIGQAVQNL